ncbi:MAG: nicotinamide riboside transporter PnuC [Puniceicoccaceae bacterium]
MDAILSQMQQTSWLEWLGTLTGLAAVVLSIRERVLAWPLFVSCYALYVVLSWQASLPAAMALNALFIPISLYGWWSWQRGRQQSACGQEALSISRMPGKIRNLAVISIAGATLLLGWVNQRWIGGALPYLDAFATISSLAAQWMLSRKWVENWIAWILADLAFALLWGLQGYAVTVIMFAVFTLLAICGWCSWYRTQAKP